MSWKSTEWVSKLGQAGLVVERSQRECNMRGR